MKKALFSVLIALAALSAFADKTTRNKIKPIETQKESADSIYTEISEFPDSCIILTGYDKPLNADGETIIIINRLDYDIDGLSISIDYQDTKGRQFTKREVNIFTNIPAGETRQAYFRTWDRQHSYYYIKSRPPRTQATPYTVKCQILKIYIKK